VLYGATGPLARALTDRLESASFPKPVVEVNCDRPLTYRKGTTLIANYQPVNINVKAEAEADRAGLCGPQSK
jgi:hypothetical protein